MLLRTGEAWLSEETVDDLQRLRTRRVWVVDPLDGTREFVQGIPEWCVSIAMVEDGQPIAGGIANPSTGEVFIGSSTTGMTYNGTSVCVRDCKQLAGSVVLASRSEYKRGEWDCFGGRTFTVRPIGSVAYKLALVAAGLADATWTLIPKHEWDVAAGVALVRAAGGMLAGLDNNPIEFNNSNTLLPGILACAPGLYDEITTVLGWGCDGHLVHRQK